MATTPQLKFYKGQTNKETFYNLLPDQNVSGELTEVVNPYNMIHSVNLMFDNYSELSAYDSNVIVSDGKLKLSSGTEGTATSKLHAQSIDITQIHLLVIGEQYGNCIFKVSTDGGATYETVKVNQLVNILTGRNIVIQIRLVGATSEIDSLALLLK